MTSRRCVPIGQESNHNVRMLSAQVSRRILGTEFRDVVMTFHTLRRSISLYGKIRSWGIPSIKGESSSGKFRLRGLTDHVGITLELSRHLSSWKQYSGFVTTDRQLNKGKICALFIYDILYRLGLFVTCIILLSIQLRKCIMPSPACSLGLGFRCLFTTQSLPGRARRTQPRGLGQAGWEHVVETWKATTCDCISVGTENTCETYFVRLVATGTPAFQVYTDLVPSGTVS